MSWLKRIVHVGLLNQEGGGRECRIVGSSKDDRHHDEMKEIVNLWLVATEQAFQILCLPRLHDDTAGFHSNFRVHESKYRSSPLALMPTPLRHDSGGKEGKRRKDGRREGREEVLDTKDSGSASPSLHPTTEERKHGHTDMPAPIQTMKKECQIHPFPKEQPFPPTHPLFIRPLLVHFDPAGGVVFEQAKICSVQRASPSSPSTTSLFTKHHLCLSL